MRSVKYWWQVIKRSWISTLGLVGIRRYFVAALLTGLALLIIPAITRIQIPVAEEYLTHLPEKLQGRLLVQIFIIATGLFAYTLFLFVFNLIATPARMYDEMGGFDQLKLRCVLGCHPSRRANAWATLTIHNNSLKPFERCSVILESVIMVSDPSGQERIRREEALEWSHSHPHVHEDKDIPRLERRTADIARTDVDSGRIVFTTRSPDHLRDKVYPGEYVVRLRVEGIYGNKRHEMEKTVKIAYEGGGSFSSCSEL